MPTDERFVVEQGPVENFLRSLGGGLSHGTRLPAIFYVQEIGDVHVYIDSISRDDEAGIRFRFEGATEHFNNNVLNCNLRGVYDTMTGQGWVEIVR